MIEPFLLLPQNQSAVMMIHIITALQFWGLVVGAVTIDVAKGQVVISKMQSVWTRSRSFFSCFLNYTTQRTLTLALAWQHIHAGVGGGWRRPTVATIRNVGPPSTTSTPTSTVTIPVCNVNGILLGRTTQALILMQVL